MNMEPEEKALLEDVFVELCATKPLNPRLIKVNKSLLEMIVPKLAPANLNWGKIESLTG